MPGRHGKQRIKKKKSKRLPVTEMEKTLKDSIHGRKRKEKEILKNLIPPMVIPKVKKPVLSADLPMFNSVSSPTAASIKNAATTAVESKSAESKKTKKS